MGWFFFFTKLFYWRLPYLIALHFFKILLNSSKPLYLLLLNLSFFTQALKKLSIVSSERDRLPGQSETLDVAQDAAFNVWDDGEATGTVGHPPGGAGPGAGEASRSPGHVRAQHHGVVAPSHQGEVVHILPHEALGGA